MKWKFSWEDLLLPLIGIAALFITWQLISSSQRTDLPSPSTTWEASKLLVLHPLEKRGEQDQGLLRLVWCSLILVAKGYPLGLLIGTPLGLLMGSSRWIYKIIDPIAQITRPVSPLAWFPLGVLLFKNLQSASVFAIAICSMWPTVVNTAKGVHAIPQDYWNVARVLKLSRWKTLFKIVIPATLPYMFTGFRLSLGLAWLVIVAAEMLTGAPGIGGFLYSEYNGAIYTHLVTCILTIGLTGLVMDRLMTVAENWLKSYTTI